MADNIATRQAYGEFLVEIGAENPDVVVLDGDLSSATQTKLFAKAYPERFFNVGIAEQNLYGMAAGLAISGKIPFASTFAMFASGRAYEIIRNSICYTGANVKVCATHGGVTVGEDGASHQCVEDFALMRVLPGMVVMSPADAVSAKKLLRQILEYKGPVYSRFGRAAVPIIYSEDAEITLGKAAKLREGKDATVIANGVLVSEALKAAELLAGEGIEIRILDMHTLKPLDEDAVLAAAEDTGCLVTAEEHSVIGGLGGAVAEVLGRRRPTPLEMVGVQDTFGHSGKAMELLAEFHLAAPDIAAAVKRAVARKSQR